MSKDITPHSGVYLRHAAKHARLSYALSVLEVGDFQSVFWWFVAYFF